MPVILYNPEARTGAGDQEDSAIDWIEFDAVVGVTHSGRNEVTRFPVEAGAKPSDHSVPQPREIQLTDAIVTNYPISLPGAAEVAALAEQGLSLNTLSAAANPSNLESFGRSIAAIEPVAEQAYDLLDKWRENGTVLTLVDDLKSYDKVVIESVTTPRTAKTSNSIHTQIQLVEHSAVSTDLVAAPDPKPGRTRASKKRKQGSTSKDDATDGESEQGGILYELTPDSFKQNLQSFQ